VSDAPKNRLTTPAAPVRGPGPLPSAPSVASTPVADQIASAAAELRKLIDRIEQEAVGALESPSMERLAAFDGHRRVLDSTMMVLRRTLVRRVEREQSKTEPDEAEADQTGPVVAPSSKTIRPPK
jgi:hypothetical protein